MGACSATRLTRKSAGSDVSIAKLRKYDIWLLIKCVYCHRLTPAFYALPRTLPSPIQVFFLAIGRISRHALKPSGVRSAGLQPAWRVHIRITGGSKPSCAIIASFKPVTDRRSRARHGAADQPQPRGWPRAGGAGWRGRTFGHGCGWCYRTQPRSVRLRRCQNGQKIAKARAKG